MRDDALVYWRHIYRSRLRFWLGFRLRLRLRRRDVLRGRLDDGPGSGRRRCRRSCREFGPGLARRVPRGRAIAVFERSMGRREYVELRLGLEKCGK
jgi:hypothetical protein